MKPFLAAILLGLSATRAVAVDLPPNLPAQPINPYLALPRGAAPRDQAIATLPQVADQMARTPDVVVADVDGTPITLGMVADRIRDLPPNLAALPTSAIYKGALEDLIEQRALAIKARQLGLDKDPTTNRRFAEAMDHELGRSLVRRLVPEMVTEEAIRKHYDAAIAGKPGPAEVQFRVIGATSEAEANSILDQLRNGGDFADLARRYSKDPSAFSGGEIDYASRDLLTPEIGAVVFALAPGQMTAYPVASNGIWFVIQVEGRRQRATPTLQEARPALTVELERAASREVFTKSRQAVTVDDFGPTGMRGSAAKSAEKGH